MAEKTYAIKNDESNWILVEKSETAQGKPTEKNLAYYGSLEAFVKSVHNKMLLVHGMDRAEEALRIAEDLVVKAVAIINEPAAAALAKIRSKK